MAKIKYLPGLLSGIALLICSSAWPIGIANYEVNYATVNRATRSPSINASPVDDRARIKRIYDSQIGVRETRPNAGPQVEKYLRYVGLGHGQPWCAAFVCWVLAEAGLRNPRSGWSPDLFTESKVVWKRTTLTGTVNQKLANRKYVPPAASTATRKVAATPAPGDVFGIYFPEKKRIAHCGFVDAWNGSWVTTVEGNTNGSGDRDGDGVYRKRRQVSTIYRVSRYVN